MRRLRYLRDTILRLAISSDGIVLSGPGQLVISILSGVTDTVIGSPI